MSTIAPAAPTAERRVGLPAPGLLALFCAGFLGIINETMPAGLLPEMARGLGISEALAGQTITVYALATALTAIPLNALLRDVDRRTLLVAALVVYALANAVIALTSSVPVILVARGVAGVGAGLIWSNIGGTAARLAPEHLQSRAIAIAMAGIPAALSLGLPAGTLLGDAAGWQTTFGVTAAASVALIGWLLLSLPRLPGRPDGGHVPVGTILRARGVRTILVIVVGYMVAHTLLYTYVGPLATAADVGDQLTLVLLTFGAAALVSILGTGSLVDPHHHRLTTSSAVLLGLSALGLRLAVSEPVVLYVSVAAWGFAFGGSATLFLTAGIRAAGTDGVQSMLVTAFNLSIAAGGVLGGLLLSGLGITAVPWVAFGLMVPTALGTIAASRHAFPRWPTRA